MKSNNKRLANLIWSFDGAKIVIRSGNYKPCLLGTRAIECSPTAHQMSRREDERGWHRRKNCEIQTSTMSNRSPSVSGKLGRRDVIHQTPAKYSTSKLVAIAYFIHW